VILITSAQNPRVKDALRLRDRRHRDKLRRILIDGARELDRAMRAGVRLWEVFVCQSWCDSPDAQRVLQQIPNSGAEVLAVSENVFQKLAFGQRAEGVLGVAETPSRRLDEIDLPENPRVVVLEGVEKPGNVGAVLRSADGAGMSALVVADSRTDLYNPNAIRASLGTIFTLPATAATTAETLDWLRRRGLAIYAAVVQGRLTYDQADYRGPTAIVLGSEAQGLSKAWSASDITPICLPMLGAADSLNVSATAAVLCYESLRQRRSGV
jgi:TrmH family RNA methyltransferase